MKVTASDLEVRRRVRQALRELRQARAAGDNEAGRRAEREMNALLDVLAARAATGSVAA